MPMERLNSGTLGRNKRKEKPTHPDHKGQADVDGVAYWISAWIKENKETGEKFFSLTFERKQQQPRLADEIAQNRQVSQSSQRRPTPSHAPRLPDDDDDLPF